MKQCFYCLGNHETSQCISQATKNITDVHESAFKAIVEVTEKMSYSFNKAIEEAGYSASAEITELKYAIADGLNNVHVAITELHDFLIWSHSEVTWRMEKQIELLTGIHNMFKKPKGNSG